MKIHQIDVGCANAYLLQFEGKNIFIDGGLGRDYTKVEKYLDKYNVEIIDLYIGTHWHGDHVDNALRIVQNYGNEETLVLGPGKTVSGLVSLLKKRVHTGLSRDKISSEIKYRQLVTGDYIKLGDMKLTVVGPYKLRDDGSVNYDSLNFLVTYGNFSMLFTGDWVHSEKIIEMYGKHLKDIDVLQMPHHGLKPLCITSTALKYLNPEVILVPANSSSPTKNAVKQNNLRAQVFDNSYGNIVISTTGEGAWKLSSDRKK